MNIPTAREAYVLSNNYTTIREALYQEIIDAINAGLYSKHT